MAILEPASLAFAADRRTPFSKNYEDVYHSADSGPGQARHVFLDGNDLPERWSQARSFTIIETGFGLGLNFFSTWQAWRADPQRCEYLHFISIEKHPFDHAALCILHANYPELAAFASPLRAVWPLTVAGFHRRNFDDGRITLTLAFGDIATVLPQLRGEADAFYLDGFAPERNPDMWTPRIMKALARLANPGATFSTYTTARTVRDALSAAGFAVEKRAGFGRKRHLLAGRFIVTRHVNRQALTRQPFARRAVVIGAGLAGAAAAERLASRGWRVELIERGTRPATAASGMPAAIHRPHLSPDDCLLSRFTRAAFLYALSYWQELQRAGHEFTWHRCGVLQVASDAPEAARMRETAHALKYPTHYVQYVTPKAAAQHANYGAAYGGWWFPSGGWLCPAELVTAQLAVSKNICVHFNAEVHAVVRDDRDSGWQVLARDGTTIAQAPIVVLANAHDAGRLVAINAPLQRVRGQLTLLSVNAAQLGAVICGNGYVLQSARGFLLVGSGYDRSGIDSGSEAPERARNLERAANLLPALEINDSMVRDDSIGWRCAAADHLPLIGPLPDMATIRAHKTALKGAQAANLPRLPGLYGAFGYASRGLTWAALGGELLAGIINGEPLPLERDLANAVDPGRFALKQVRRGKLMSCEPS